MSKPLFLVFLVGVILLPVSAGLALLLGIVFATLVSNPYLIEIKKYNHRLLSLAIVGLGATVNLYTVLKVGASGVGYTALGIATTFVLGYVFSRIYSLPKEISLLISTGTAICGGSAIAAVSSTLKSKNEDTAVALSVVFILNAVGLWIFPTLGQWAQLSAHDFGLWCALAIHDTSSVVGAAMQWGDEALQVATTVKLARALWIVPLALTLGFLNKRKSAGSFKFPWFIVGFLLVSYLVTQFPFLQSYAGNVGFVARKAFVLALFFVGSTINLKQIKALGPKPFYFGVTLWFLVSVGSLFLLK